MEETQFLEIFEKHCKEYPDEINPESLIRASRCPFPKMCSSQQKCMSMFWDYSSPHCIPQCPISDEWKNQTQYFETHTKTIWVTCEVSAILRDKMLEIARKYVPKEET